MQQDIITFLYVIRIIQLKFWVKCDQKEKFLLTWTSFIGQFVHPVLGEGVGQRGWIRGSLF